MWDRVKSRIKVCVYKSSFVSSLSLSLSFFFFVFLRHITVVLYPYILSFPHKTIRTDVLLSFPSSNGHLISFNVMHIWSQMFRVCCSAYLSDLSEWNLSCVLMVRPAHWTWMSYNLAFRRGFNRSLNVRACDYQRLFQKPDKKKKSIQTMQINPKPNETKLKTKPNKLTHNFLRYFHLCLYNIGNI